MRDLQLGDMSLDSAVNTSIGAASTCWTIGGVFDSSAAYDIAKQLIERIRQEYPSRPKRKVGRDAITGKFVSADYVEANPDTTVTEKI